MKAIWGGNPVRLWAAMPLPAELRTSSTESSRKVEPENVGSGGGVAISFASGGGGRSHAVMNPTAESREYRVWALDDSVYGPVRIDVLRDWVRDERILPESWVFCETTRRWLQAGRMSELSLLFGLDETASPPGGDPGATALKPSILRRIRAFGDLTDEDLAGLIRMGEMIQMPAFQTIMRANTPCDVIYFVIEGQVRQRITVRQREMLIAVKEAGTAFGYISLFDGGPHVTDAVSDSPVTLFRISTTRLRDLCVARPELGVSVLLSLGRSLAQRIRSDDRHLYELVALNQGRT